MRAGAFNGAGDCHKGRFGQHLADCSAKGAVTSLHLSPICRMDHLILQPHMPAHIPHSQIGDS